MGNCLTDLFSVWYCTFYCAHEQQLKKCEKMLVIVGSKRSGFFVDGPRKKYVHAFTNKMEQLALRLCFRYFLDVKVCSVGRSCVHLCATSANAWGLCFIPLNVSIALQTDVRLGGHSSCQTLW